MVESEKVRFHHAKMRVHLVPPDAGLQERTTSPHYNVGLTLSDI
jgi:hypothetical protein